MNQYRTERFLCGLYALIGILLTISVLCLVIPYNHWRATLDVCPGSWLENNNCGCILYGLSASQYFNGGHNSYCLYAIFAPLPILAYAIIMALFHMYRVCISDIGKYEDENKTTMDEIEGESIVISSRTRVSQRNDGIIHCWIPTSCVAAVFGIYNIVHSSIITMGFMKTCSQYRSYLVRELRASGDQTTVIHFRLSCQAIFDFMDYIQKDSPNSRRGNIINTGLALQLAVITSWLAVLLWIFVTISTAQRAYKEKRVISCCGN